MKGADDVTFNSQFLLGLFHRRLVPTFDILEIELENVFPVNLVVAIKKNVEVAQIVFLQSEAGKVAGVVLGIERVGRFGAVAVGCLLRHAHRIVLELDDVGKTIVIGIFAIDIRIGKVESVLLIPPEENTAGGACVGIIFL